ncbi:MULTISPECIES: extracellular solute-binding protein [unclassified Paenibacillus]|uniref:ABC transporter substrate-binding protein n=1 Tax=unclassified Paenibacillus TaxID=185978 RepID=UPI00095632AD|nr:MULTISPECIES: extracellular solute-binding protein [unclassified Paenibacillus]ASS67801.1 extracellular solute-binding protein [Paenibacillus sp. RUD330]SIR60418.1 multiple sugar transport system substrate-binding protein [Paenibacillus sp. RU4X]SIR69261.1 multiple sugar transport system substrate-binding protein [Paenibacillus sp. RU4T]
MKKRSRFAATALALVVSAGVVSACGSNNDGGNAAAGNTGSEGASAKKDTITALLPPVSANFQANFNQMEAEFTKQYPNLTLKIEPASWEDMTQKLDTQVNAGSPPDIAFMGSEGISKYVPLGMVMDIKDAATPEMIADFDEGPLKYMYNGDGLYGFPAYMEVHAIGGNKPFLEEAGIDWKKVQQNGWTFDEFREAIKKGVVKEGNATKRYGFVFATAGVTSKDYLGILVKNAGMPAAFDKDLKYAYTSKNYLTLLTNIRQMIDDGSMPKELSSIDAGKRWNMFLTGQTMITGKGMAVFENSSRLNNEKIDKNDGSAVKDSIKTDYVVLPVPSFAGQPAVANSIVDGYVTFRGKKEPTAEHKANVAKAAYFLASGQVAATTNGELFSAPITKSSRKAAEGMESKQSPENKAAVEHLLSTAAPARPDIPAELGAKAIKLETEVIVPKLQALLAGETTPEKMYEDVKKAAIDTFGADGVVQD